MELTDWHRMFGMTLTDFFTNTAYTVELEKDLSLKKQFLDVVIIEKKEGKPTDELPDGLENMAAHNLISYKSVNESLDDWAADELTGHYVNYRKQISPSMNNLLPKTDFRLFAICTMFPSKLSKQAALKPVKQGVYDLRWGIRDIRVIVTGQISKKEKNAVWLMFSAVKDRVQYGFSSYKGRLDEMSSTMTDLFNRYKTEGIIAMTYTLEDYRRELKERALKMMTPEEVLKAFPLQEILKGLPPEEVLKTFPPRERLKGLSTEEIEAYLKKLKKPKPKRKR